jgi:hypothetical protein
MVLILPQQGTIKELIAKKRLGEVNLMDVVVNKLK